MGAVDAEGCMGVVVEQACQGYGGLEVSEGMLV